MDYEMPLASAPLGSTEGRRLLAEDDFAALDPAWKVHTSKAHERSSFTNEGKVGEIYTPANTAVFVERPLPKGTRLVEATIDVGTDRSASWGPGIALVFKARVVRFHIRPGGDAGYQKPMFAASHGGRELLRLGGLHEMDISKPWTLRLRLQDGALHLEARPTDGAWRTVHTLRAAGLGEPLAVRIGKMGISGGGMHTFFSTALDTRIKACVISGYYSTFRDSILAIQALKPGENGMREHRVEAGHGLIGQDHLRFLH